MKDFSWTAQRAAGVFMHISSLPSEYGIGNVGKAADCFFDFLSASGFSYWQICPLGPTGYGDSPYQSFSAFAGNTYFIDYGELVKDGFLKQEEVEPLKALPRRNCDFAAIYNLLPPLLRKAAARFSQTATPAQKASFAKFCRQKAQWLEPYALFTALKTRFGGKPWYEWQAPYRTYLSAKNASLELSDIDEAFSVKFGQWIFFAQYADFRRRAKEANISIFGDLPIFLSLDSAEVWQRPELFDLRRDGTPANVAGVPPDYFSETGQLWGNPLYNWKKAKDKVYSFWFERVAAALEMFDLIRFDHFRGFADYWAVPAGAKDAREGSMKKGPGIDFFNELGKRFPKGRFVAEDLGLLSKAAFDLRNELKIPAMAVLQFAFGGEPTNPYLPHNIKRECIYYTGTHDNNTSCGWYAQASEKEKDEFRRYFRASGESPNWDMIHGVMMSVAQMAVFPMQDIAGLGSECRINTPGSAQGNWQWRLLPEELACVMRQNVPYLRSIMELSGRVILKSASKKCVEI